MAIILFDNPFRKHLLPFTATRAVADLRFGILSIRERWEKLTGEKVYIHTEDYLQALYEPLPDGEHVWIDAAVIEDIRPLLDDLLPDTCFTDDKGVIVGRTAIPFANTNTDDLTAYFSSVNEHAPVQRIEYPWQLMQWNDDRIRKDFSLLTRGRASQPLNDTVHSVHPGNIFIEEGATVSHCTINASFGPVYIGKYADIMEGCTIRGPFVLGDHSVLKMNSRVYGATTLGPHCIGGGEIKNSVMMGYSNKAHDGYLGDSVVGEWCNFGAGSSNSNIKNTAGDIKVWEMGRQECVYVGQKCGVIMGDYSRVAINSSINTGSMIGVSCNVFGSGLLPTLIHHFSWGVEGNTYSLEKAIRDIDNWKKLKGKELTPAETSVLEYIFDSL